MNTKKDDELRPEYSEDLIKSGVRGKYSRRYQAESNVVVIDPDLRHQFPNAQAVNKALREYLASRNQT
jgi:hypothetical protein